MSSSGSQPTAELRQSYLQRNRSGVIIASAFILWIVDGLLVNGIVTSIPTASFMSSTQIAAFGGILTFDAILFGFLGIVANQDYERLVKWTEEYKTAKTEDKLKRTKGSRNLLKSDFVIIVFLVLSAMFSVYGILLSDSKVSPNLIGFPLWVMLLATFMLALRLADAAFLS
jgi:hypothetical protein